MAGENCRHQTAIRLVIARIIQPGVGGLGDGVIERATYLLHAVGVHAG